MRADLPGEHLRYSTSADVITSIAQWETAGYNGFLSADRMAHSLRANLVTDGLRTGKVGHALNRAVNKRLLSTGESRELVSENLGSGLNPGG